MSYSRQRDFLFCDLCGTLLSLNSTKYAQCPLCGSKRDVKGIAGREISYTVTAENIRRELGIKQLINPDGIYREEKQERDKGTISGKKCENCGHDQVIIVSRQQTRSADEGETTFYECLKCKERSKD